MSTSKRPRGQSVAEFALVLPVLVAFIGGIVQFGLIFWAQNTLTQVVRDTGRWEATQQTTPCTNGVSALVAQADLIAGNSSLLGYTSKEFGPNSPTTAQTSSAAVAAFSTSDALAVAWTDATATPPPSSDLCPPPDNSQVWFATIKVNHTVPIFFPGLQYLPGLGTCDSTGCHITLSSMAVVRMEPAPL